MDVVQGHTFLTACLKLQRSAGITGRCFARPDDVVLPRKSESGSHEKGVVCYVLMKPICCNCNRL